MHALKSNEIWEVCLQFLRINKFIKVLLSFITPHGWEIFYEKYDNKVSSNSNPHHPPPFYFNLKWIDEEFIVFYQNITLNLSSLIPSCIEYVSYLFCGATKAMMMMILVKAGWMAGIENRENSRRKKKSIRIARTTVWERESEWIFRM